MRYIVIFVALLAFAIAPSCGSGQGYRVPIDPLVIMSTTFPQTLSGEAVDFAIELEGGCGGQYIVEIIDGRLPDGVAVDDDNGRHHITGIVLESGRFPVVIRITDVGCEPDFSTFASFTWEVGVGPLKIVAANPPIIPVANFNDPAKYNDIDALETTVFSTFISYDLIAAGGVPGISGYSCIIVDDPLDPNDGPPALPLGVSMVPNSCTLVGTPSQVLPGGVPFRFTVRVTDSVGNSAERKFQWKIDTPPIILPQDTFGNGQAGLVFSDSITAVDGVPPLLFEFVDDVPGDDPTNDLSKFDDITFASPAVPTVNSTEGGKTITLLEAGPSSDARLNATAAVDTVNGQAGPSRTVYPALNDFGPDYGGNQVAPAGTGNPYPSEGLYMKTSGASAGAILGTPRRRGDFRVFVHAWSTLVPKERGQHAFKPISFSIAASNPFEMDPAVTLEQSFASKPTLPEAEVLQNYNPDTTFHMAAGLKLRALGGVRADGRIDSPHENTRFQALTTAEIENEYDWAVSDTVGGAFGQDVLPVGQNLANLPGLSLFNRYVGLFGTETAADQVALVRSSATDFDIQCNDWQLPLQVRNEVRRPFCISVGPDLVIVTESSVGSTATSTTSNGDYQMHDDQLILQKLEFIGGSGTVSPLGATELSVGTSIPGIAALNTPDDIGELLSTDEMDLLRPTPNPTHYGYDNHNMNPHGARARMNVDMQRSWSAWNNQYRSGGGSWQPSVSSLDIPPAPTVATVPGYSNGVRNDGGQLYFYETKDTTANSKRIGVFIIRKNSQIYVPWACLKGTNGVEHFADGVSADIKFGASSILTAVPVTVSPDNRFAAFKVTSHNDNPGGTSTSLSSRSLVSNSRIVIISLCGEALWGGNTYKFVDPTPGVSDNYLYSTSMAMSNDYLYWLTGQNSGATASIEGHWVHRLRIDDGSGAGSLAPVAAANANWTQTTTVPMDCPFHLWNTLVQRASAFAPGGTTFYFTTQDEMYLYDGWNGFESSLAPMPFRCSGDGGHMACLAGPNQPSAGSANVMSHYVWVDSNGNGFRQASATRRHMPQGAGRGYSLTRGPRNYQHWGRFTGPTTGFEICHDGSRVAGCYNTRGTINSWFGSNSEWNNNRQDVFAVSATGGNAADPWTSRTGDVLITPTKFGGTILWRFGALVFTKDGDGLFFWGGMSAHNGTSTASPTRGNSSSASYHFSGQFYSYNFLNDEVRYVMPTTAGGTTGGGGLITTAFVPNPTSTYVQTAGNVKPMGGFISKNGNFFYVVNMHPNSSSDQTQLTLLGINISSLTGPTINGHAAGRGFKLGNWPNRRGFIPNYYYQPHYVLDDAYYLAAHAQIAGLQHLNRETGNVYFASHYQRSGPTQQTGTSSFTVFSGPQIPQFWGDYGYVGGAIEGFAADVGGPINRLSTNTTSNTATRMINYISVDPKGDRLAYVYNTGGTTVRHEREFVGVVRNIRLNPTTGALEGTLDAFNAEAAQGRAGEKMAFDTGGTKLYYAFKSGGANEDVKELVEYAVNPATNARTPTRRPGGERFSVLHAGR